MCKAYPPATYNTAAVAVAAPISIEGNQRNYLIDRTSTVREDHIRKLRAQYFMDSEDGPVTAEALIKAIKENDYTLDEKTLENHADQLHYYNVFFGIKWGKNKPDAKGYEVAIDALKAETQEVMDAVHTAPYDDARKAFEEFKNWTLPTSTTAA